MITTLNRVNLSEFIKGFLGRRGIEVDIVYDELDAYFAGLPDDEFRNGDSPAYADITSKRIILIASRLTELHLTGDELDMVLLHEAGHICNQSGNEKLADEFAMDYCERDDYSTLIHKLYPSKQAILNGPPEYRHRIMYW